MHSLTSRQILLRGFPINFIQFWKSREKELLKCNWIAVDQSLQSDRTYSAVEEIKMSLRKHINYYLGVCVMMRSLILGIKVVILLVI